MADRQEYSTFVHQSDDITHNQLKQLIGILKYHLVMKYYFYRL